MGPGLGGVLDGGVKLKHAFAGWEWCFLKWRGREQRWRSQRNCGCGTGIKGPVDGDGKGRCMQIEVRWSGPLAGV